MQRILYFRNPEDNILIRFIELLDENGGKWTQYVISAFRYYQKTGRFLHLATVDGTKCRKTYDEILQKPFYIRDEQLLEDIRAFGNINNTLKYILSNGITVTSGEEYIISRYELSAELRKVGVSNLEVPKQRTARTSDRNDSLQKAHNTVGKRKENVEIKEPLVKTPVRENNEVKADEKNSEIASSLKENFGDDYESFQHIEINFDDL